MNAGLKTKYSKILNKELSFPELDEYLEGNGWDVKSIPPDGDPDGFDSYDDADAFKRELDNYSALQYRYYRDWEHAKVLADAIMNNNINKSALDSLLNDIGKKMAWADGKDLFETEGL